MGQEEPYKRIKEIASHHRDSEDNFEDFHANDKNNSDKYIFKKGQGHSRSNHSSTKVKSKLKLRSNITRPAHENSLSEISSNSLHTTENNSNTSDDCDNANAETKRKDKHKRKRNRRDESFEELSDRKMKIVMELQALDAEEAGRGGKRKKSRNNSRHNQQSQEKPVPVKQEIVTDEESNVRTQKVRKEPRHHDTQKSSSDGDQRKYKTKYTSEKHTVKIKHEPRADYHRKQNFRHNNKVYSAKLKREPNDDESGRFHQRMKTDRRISTNRIKQERDMNSRSRHPNQSIFRRGNPAATSDAENMEWGRPNQERPVKKEVKEKEKPSFETSGKLAEDTNTFNGVVIKYNEPAEACKPRRRWRLYPFKGTDSLPFIPIHRQSAYLLGRSRLIADIPIDHPSCSKQHAVLQFRLTPYTREDGSKGRSVRPYIIDLDSANGTFINNKQIDPRRYMELLEKDVLKFGFSSRVYVILHEESKIDKEEDDEGQIGESPSPS